MSDTPDITFALAHDGTTWIVTAQTPVAQNWMAHVLPDGREYTTIDPRHFEMYRSMAARAGLVVGVREMSHRAMIQ